MRTACLWLLLMTGLAGRALAQTPVKLSAPPSPDSLILILRAINAGITASPISSRAMNVYLSNKIGYYLSESDNLTLYKNSVLFDAATGEVTINHSLFQPQGLDENIRSFSTIGVRANAADAYSATIDNRRYNNRFGFVGKQTWLSKPHIRYTAAQKTTMDALRAGMLDQLEQEIRQKSATWAPALTSSDAARRQFNTSLYNDYNFAFALQQSQAVIDVLAYQLITLNWTSVSAYIPLINESFTVKPDSSIHHAYPLQLNVSHTRLWESVRAGRLYCTLAGNVQLTDSALLPALKTVVAYFPPNSHVGFSGHLEQNFGPYHALNAIVGVPIVLINKHAEPVCNFEFQVRFFATTSIGLTLGIPFSKICF